MPGVLILEALAQMGAICILLVWKTLKAKYDF